MQLAPPVAEEVVSQPPSTRRRDLLWAVLVSAETVCALVLVGLGAHWMTRAVGLPGSVPASERVVQLTYRRHEAAFMLGLAAVTGLLGAGAAQAWRIAGGRQPGPAGRWFREGLVAAQPFLFPAAAIAGFGSGIFGDRPAGRLSDYLVAAAVVGVVVLLWCVTGHVLRDFTLRRYALLGTVVLVAAGAGAVSQWAASGGVAANGFTDLGLQATGYPRAITSVSCLPSGTCLAVGDSPVARPGGSFEPLYTVSAGHVAAAVDIAVTPASARISFQAPEISCPTAARCLAIETAGALQLDPAAAPVLRSDDGGRTWTALPPPLPTAPPGSPSISADLGCMTADRCVLADSNVVVQTTDGGAHWSTVASLPPIRASRPFNPIVACAGAEDCVVALPTPQSDTTQVQLRPAALLLTSNGGHSWTRVELPAAVGTLSSIWCSADGHCLMTGLRLRAHAGAVVTEAMSADGGRTWTVHAGGGAGAGAESLACQSDQHCVGILPGSGIVATDDGGTTWHVVLAGSFSSLSCSGSVCAAAGYGEGQHPAVVLTTDAGSTWKTLVVPPAPLPAIDRTPYFPPYDIAG